MSPWRDRNFRLVWTGSFVNDIGDWLLMVALPVYVFAETRSGVATALLFAIEYGLGMIVGPWAGSLVDRWDLRRTLIATNLLQAVTLLPLLAVTPDRIWPAFLVAAAQALLTRLNNPAGVALLPRLVPPDQLVAANAANATSGSLARLIGSPLGGIVVQAGGLHAVIIADGLSFLAVALLTSLVRADARPLAAADADRGGHVRAGFAAVRDHPSLRRLVTIIGVIQVAQGMFLVLFVAFVIERLHGSGSAVGIIRGTQAVGGIVGSLVIARLAARVEAGRLLTAGLIGMGVAAMIFWNAPAVTTSLVVAAILFSLAGGPGAAMQVGFLTVAQQSAPPEVLGRVMGTTDAVGLAGAAVGSIATGVLLDHVGLTPLLEVQALLYLGAGTYALATLVRRGRNVPR